MYLLDDSFQASIVWSLPTICLNHCLATIKGAYTSNCKLACLNGDVCPSLARNLIRFMSLSFNSLDSLSNETLAALTTVKSDPITSTNLTYPLSKTVVLAFSILFLLPVDCSSNLFPHIQSLS